MKNNLFYIKTIIAVLTSLSVILSSCEKNNPDVPVKPRGTITDIVSSGSGFTLLKAAVLRAQYQDSLTNKKDITLFAPTDDAFKALGLSTAAAIEVADTATLRAILRYHVLNSTIPETLVPAGPNATVNTWGGRSIFVTRDTRGVFVNGLAVQQTDIQASNGVIHAINRVLVPPAVNVVQFIQSSSGFSILTTALLRANTSAGPDLVSALNNTSRPVTLFAPADSAFRNAGFADVAAINAADSSVLRRILSLHIIPKRIFSSDIVNNATEQSFLGQGITITYRVATNSGVTTFQLRGPGNATNTFADIRLANTVVTNGIIHGISRVIIP